MLYDAYCVMCAAQVVGYLTCFGISSIRNAYGTVGSSNRSQQVFTGCKVCQQSITYEIKWKVGGSVRVVSPKSVA